MFPNYEIKLFESVESHLEIRPLLTAHHYLGESMPRGCKYWYCLFVDNKLAGLCVFGIPSGRNVVTRYGQNTLELRRFVLAPEHNGKNVGSWFIAKCLKELKQYNVISYCDTSAGFSGGLYKASNFISLGVQRQGSTRVMMAGKPVFAQSSTALKLHKKDLVYMVPKQIWFYPAYNKRDGVAEKYSTHQITKKKNIEVLDLSTGIIYSNIQEAADDTKTTRKTVSDHTLFKVKVCRFVRLEK